MLEPNALSIGTRHANCHSFEWDDAIDAKFGMEKQQQRTHQNAGFRFTAQPRHRWKADPEGCATVRYDDDSTARLALINRPTLCFSAEMYGAANHSSPAKEERHRTEIGEIYNFVIIINRKPKTKLIKCKCFNVKRKMEWRKQRGENKRFLNANCTTTNGRKNRDTALSRARDEKSFGSLRDGLALRKT